MEEVCRLSNWYPKPSQSKLRKLKINREDDGIDAYDHKSHKQIFKQSIGNNY